MNRRALHFTELHVHSAPGCAGGWQLRELSAGINIVFGPNAAGKTTTARALTALLWPSYAVTRDEFAACFQFDGAQWHAEVHGNHADYQRNNAQSPPPSLPVAENLHGRCNVALHELLQIGDSEIGKAILFAAAGDCDLDGVAVALGFDGNPRFKRNAKDDFENARREVRRTADEAAPLATDSARLVQMDGDLQDAKLASEQATLLAQAIEQRRILAAHAVAEANLAVFDARLAKLKGDEVVLMEGKQRALAMLRSQQDDAQRVIEAASADIAECRLPDDGIATAKLTELRTQLEALRAADDEISRLGDDLAAENAHVERAREVLALTRDEAALDLPQLNELAEFVREWEEHRAAESAARRWREWLGEADTAVDVDALRTAELVLANWLRTPIAATVTGPRWLRPTLLAIAVFVALGSGALALMATAAAWLGLLPAIALVVIALVRHAPSAAGPQTMFPASVTAPTAWETNAVQQRLAEIHTQLANAEHAATKRREIETIEPAWERIAERETALEKQRTELCAQLGCKLDPRLFTMFVEHAREWSKARTAAEQISKQNEARTEARVKMLTRIAGNLMPLGVEAPADYAQARGAIEDLATREQRWREARAELASRQREHAQFGKQCERIELETSAALAKAAVADGTELENLMRDFDAYTAACDVEKTQRGSRDAAKAFFQKHTELVERTAEELEHQRGNAAEHGGKVEALVAAKTAIETRIGEAKRKTALEDAVAKRDVAKRLLLDARETQLAALAGHLVAEHVRQQMGELAMPPVFEHARELFGRFTSHHCELVPPDSEGGFRARDTTAGGAARALDELSSGTRVQLLLAVRAAFIASEEAAFNVRLPLLLDETLANSDDHRAQQIIKAIADLAREGRQIFYFTAQTDEVVKWREYFSQHADVPCHIADLAAARGAEPARFERIAGAAPVTAPEPGALTHEEYGRLLDAPPFDPRQEIGAAHLWHVCEDTKTLHRLLTMGFERWGQIEVALRKDGSVLGGAEQRLRANAELLAELARLWRHGRGRPLDHFALSEGGVTNAFIERVWEIAVREGRDAARVLAAIEGGEVARFRGASCERLREYCEENGYLERESPLDAATIRAPLQIRALELGIESARVEALLAKIMANNTAPSPDSPTPLDTVPGAVR